MKLERRATKASIAKIEAMKKIKAAYGIAKEKNQIKVYKVEPILFSPDKYV